MEYQEILTEEEKQLIDMYRRASKEIQRLVLNGMDAVENLAEHDRLSKAAIEVIRTAKEKNDEHD